MKKVDRTVVLNYLERMFSDPGNKVKYILEEANWEQCEANCDSDSDEANMLRLEIEEMLKEVYEVASDKIKEMRQK